MMGAPKLLDSVVVDVDAGRRLAVSSWGQPSGRPLFVLHGTPGSRLLRHVAPPDMTYADLGVQAITYDRPGYGQSTGQPGRRVIDAASDVARIADALGIARFGVFGISGGAAHALAVAAALPDRVTRCATVVGTAPLHAPDLEFYDGMAADEQEFWHSVEVQDLAALGARWAQFVRWVEEAMPGVSVPERVIAMLREASVESTRQGPDGFLEDCLAFSVPWGFQMEQIGVPTKLMFARDDGGTPPQHVAWFERHLVSAAIEWVDGDHLGPRDEPEMALVTWAAGG